METVNIQRWDLLDFVKNHVPTKAGYYTLINCFQSDMQDSTEIVCNVPEAQIVQEISASFIDEPSWEGDDVPRIMATW